MPLALGFPHDKHRPVNCIQCHHNFADRSGEDSCISCHRSGRAAIRTGAEARFHDFCLGCHRDPPAYLTGHGPVTGCNTCHAPLSGAALRGCGAGQGWADLSLKTACDSARSRLQSLRAISASSGRSLQRRSRSCAAGQSSVNSNSPLCSVWSLVRFAIGNRGDANQLDLRKRCCARSATIPSTSLERYPELPNLKHRVRKIGAAHWTRYDRDRPTLTPRASCAPTIWAVA